MTVKKKLPPKLSINYILQHRTPEDIFSYYFNLPAHEITEAIVSGKAIYAPYRDDYSGGKPSLGFYENTGKLYARDFSGYFWGDCFDAAAFALHNNGRGKEFYALLEHIAKDLNILEGSRNTIQYNIDRAERIRKAKLIISVNPRDWDLVDKKYWKDKYGISSQLLDEYLVIPVQNFFINGLLRYSFTRSNPCYAYYFGVDADGLENWKLYFPLADKDKGQRKFLQNCSVIEGVLHIKKARVGLLTKSYKDVLAAETVARFNHLSLLALACPSEGIILNPKQYNQLMEYVDVLYTLSDYDRAGIHFAYLMRRNYNTTPLLFTRGKFNKLDFKAKDLSDNLELYGLDNISKLANIIYNNGHQDLLNKITL